MRPYKWRWRWAFFAQQLPNGSKTHGKTAARNKRQAAEVLGI